MRGLYAHASDRMRGDLEAALQARWADSLRARAALHEYSPVPLLDELLAPCGGETTQPAAQRLTLRQRRRHAQARRPGKNGNRETKNGEWERR